MMRLHLRPTVCAVSLLLTLAGSARAGEAALTPIGGEGRVDPQLAAGVARGQIQRCGSAAAFTLSTIRPVPDPADGTVLYYCCDLAPQGYVVVSATRDLPPVVAYSFTGNAGSESDVDNPLHALLRADLHNRRVHLTELPAEVLQQRHAGWAQRADPTSRGAEEPRLQQWPPAGSTTTGGWVETLWTQNAPYNALCPTDPANGQRCLAGCPAVAMAQILHYHRRLNATHFDDSDDYYHNYAGRSYWIDDAYLARGFPSFPQLNTHLDTLFNNYYFGTKPSNTPIAALVFACGVAATQVYTYSGSGTFGVSQALDAYQRFGCTSAELMYAESPGPYTRLAENMMGGYPAHLAIVNTGWTSGHNVVVDGYNTDEYYHLNFGWGGSYNGWYLLPSELPFGLTVIEGIIVDIMTDPCGPMDCTCDGRVDAADWTYFVGCLTGPAGGLNAPGCKAFDAEPDGDVDLADFAQFQQLFSVPGS
jgi:hypothetical protein